MRKILMFFLAVLLTAGIAVPPTNAAFLFWKKVIGRSKTEAGCMKMRRPTVSATSASNLAR